MFIVEALFNGLYFLQAHPLYWQAPLVLLLHSAAFSWFKHKVALEGKARITAWLTATSAILVYLHLAIVGLPVLVSVHALKLTAEQTVFYVGGITLAYNFLKDRVIAFLTSAESAAPAPKQPTVVTPENQNSPEPTTPAAVDSGVVTI